MHLTFTNHPNISNSELKPWFHFNNNGQQLPIYGVVTVLSFNSILYRQHTKNAVCTTGQKFTMRPWWELETLPKWFSPQHNLEHCTLWVPEPVELVMRCNMIRRVCTKPVLHRLKVDKSFVLYVTLLPEHGPWSTLYCAWLWLLKIRWYIQLYTSIHSVLCQVPWSVCTTTRAILKAFPAVNIALAQKINHFYYHHWAWFSGGFSTWKFFQGPPFWNLIWQ